MYFRQYINVINFKTSCNMATFSKDVVLAANPILIPEIAKQIESAFRKDGFEVLVDQLSSGGADISISKGGVFKAVLGMKTALKVTLTPQAGAIHLLADVGIFGQQFLPTLISWFYLWPVLLTQIWGLVQQSKMDDRVVEIANRVIAQKVCATTEPTSTPSVARFCSNCGAKVAPDAKFCPECGSKL